MTAEIVKTKTTDPRDEDEKSTTKKIKYRPEDTAHDIAEQIERATAEARRQAAEREKKTKK
ncbi:MAG: hypothetical protein UX31_C0016G0024 [Candidatus Nomurabacteria bacterium GW2011_GWA1_46_11]|uniref:Uncharacterized protein n=1 Tax=Candidatus Nomurabacteria bacterium GW2011_GWA1_46_11 TaxID=1618732 RepID=A0A0G1NMF9_9BACT|nr:MAG: hypothetical protein UW73_C0021G0001 [Microgenomates group bacterium GW2011_GWB1_44_8]KKU21547.1 MAG: hypothetical protein UX31_C0016G0024 [Candidatus Nomurabacteria bacterium GW2011_GWA1_46_11]